MSALIRLHCNLIRRSLTIPICRSISTTQAVNAPPQNECKPVTTSNKNWVSYGFDNRNEKNDRISTHAIFFASITLCLVFGGLGFAYVPDYNLSDWSVREAFIQLKKREAEGLPLVDPNLIDPSNIDLPSDEDLGDTEIII